MTNYKDIKLPVIIGKTDKPSLPKDADHPNKAYFTQKFNNLVDFVVDAEIFTSLSLVSKTGLYSDLIGLPTLGTAASRDTGTLTNQILIFSEDNKLPTLDGSLLTDVNASLLEGNSPLYYRDRANHTGTQPASTISGLADVATTGDYNDLINLPPASTNDDEVKDIIFNYIETGSGLKKTLDPITETIYLNPHQVVGTGNVSTQYNNTLGLISISYTPPAEAEPSYLLSRVNHTGTQSASTITGLATVATTGAYSDLSGRPILGTASSRTAGTAAGNVLLLSATNKLPALDGSLLTNLPPQTNAENTNTLNNKLPSYYLDRTNHTGTQSVSTITGLGTSSTINAGTLAGEVLLLAEDNKLPALDGSLLTNITATIDNANTLNNQLPSYYLDRTNHTGTQAATTITGLATVATTGAYSDLSGRPILGTAASKNTGTLTNQVLIFSENNKLPALDGSLLTNITATIDNATTLNNQLPSYYLDRTNHTGTQAATTITGLAIVATTGDYTDLLSLPTLGTAASKNTGTLAGEVLIFSEDNKLPALDGSLLTGVDAETFGTQLPSYYLDRTNHTGTQAATTITGLATVATTGDYTDLLSLPTLGTAASKNTGTLAGEVLIFSEDNKLPALDGSLLTNIISVVENANTLNNQQPSYYLDRTNHTGTQAATTITGLATVATTGDYTDLLSLPTLGTAASKNTGTLAGEVLIFSENNKLPALDGSLLTNIVSVVENANTLNNQLPSYYLDRTNHTGTQAATTITGLATVATTGDYTDLLSLPTLGTAASKNTGTLAGEVLIFSENNKLPALDGSQLTSINISLFGNQLPSYYLDRTNHTGTQAATTITGLATVATTGDYTDLLSLPTLGTAASKDTGTLAGEVLIFSEDNKLPALDGVLLTNIIASNAILFEGELPSYYLNRENHVGSQSVGTISGLGTAATKNSGTLAGQVLILSEDNKLPPLDGSQLTGVIGGGSGGSVAISDGIYLYADISQITFEGATIEATGTEVVIKNAGGSARNQILAIVQAATTI